MPVMDAAAEAALDGPVIAPAFFIMLDLADGALRATTFGQAVTFAATGDAELDGTYEPTAQMIDVGPVTNGQGGSDTLTVELSGLVTIDGDLLNDIGDLSKWRGRAARLWFRLHDESGAVQGAIAPYYTGYMSAVDILPSPTSQTIQLKIENYLAALNHASGRSYMNQRDYDVLDSSAEATLAASNGAPHSKGSWSNSNKFGWGGGISRPTGPSW